MTIGKGACENALRSGRCGKRTESSLPRSLSLDAFAAPSSIFFWSSELQNSLLVTKSNERERESISEREKEKGSRRRSPVVPFFLFGHTTQRRTCVPPAAALARGAPSSKSKSSSSRGNRRRKGKARPPSSSPSLGCGKASPRASSAAPWALSRLAMFSFLRLAVGMLPLSSPLLRAPRGEDRERNRRRRFRLCRVGWPPRPRLRPDTFSLLLVSLLLLPPFP